MDIHKGIKEKQNKCKHESGVWSNIPPDHTITHDDTVTQANNEDWQFFLCQECGYVDYREKPKD